MNLVLPKIITAQDKNDNSGILRYSNTDQDMNNHYIIKSKNLLDVKDKINRVFINYHKSRSQMQHKKEITPKDVIIKNNDKLVSKKIFKHSAVKNIILDFSNYEENALKKILTERYFKPNAKKKEGVPLNADLIELRKKKPDK